MKKPQIKDIWIEAEQWAEGEWDSEDDNSDAIVTIENGENGSLPSLPTGTFRS